MSAASVSRTHGSPESAHESTEIFDSDVRRMKSLSTGMLTDFYNALMTNLQVGFG